MVPTLCYCFVVSLNQAVSQKASSGPFGEWGPALNPFLPLEDAVHLGVCNTVSLALSMAVATCRAEGGLAWPLASLSYE